MDHMLLCKQSVLQQVRPQKWHGATGVTLGQNLSSLGHVLIWWPILWSVIVLGGVLKILTQLQYPYKLIIETNFDMGLYLEHAGAGFWMGLCARRLKIIEVGLKCRQISVQFYIRLRAEVRVQYFIWPCRHYTSCVFFFFSSHLQKQFSTWNEPWIKVSFFISQKCKSSL